MALIANRSNQRLLSELKPNQEATVLYIEGEPSVCHRIEEMGIRSGVVVRMLRTYPPQIIAIHGRRLSLRLNDELQVWVHPAVDFSVNDPA